MGKNLYERRLERASRKKPPPSEAELKNIVVKRAEEFSQAYWSTDGWSRACERKAFLLNMAVEQLKARRHYKAPSLNTAARE